jgi:hypothetical protein
MHEYIHTYIHACFGLPRFSAAFFHSLTSFRSVNKKIPFPCKSMCMRIRMRMRMQRLSICLLFVCVWISEFFCLLLCVRVDIWIFGFLLCARVNVWIFCSCECLNILFTFCERLNIWLVVYFCVNVRSLLHSCVCLSD